MKEQYCYNCYFHNDEKNKDGRFFCENVNAFMDDYDDCPYWLEDNV